jgi:hypothetical protein
MSGATPLLPCVPSWRGQGKPYLILHSIIWSVTLREEHRLRVFENRVLRGVFKPNKDEVAGLEEIT